MPLSSPSWSLLVLLAAACLRLGKAECPHGQPNWEALGPRSGYSAAYFNKVCMDGNSIVVFDESILDTMDSSFSLARLPRWDTQRLNEFVKHSTLNPDPLRPIYGTECKHHPTHFRFPTSAEVSHVRQTGFSDCTHPFLIYSNWVNTYAEYFTRPPAFSHLWQNSRSPNEHWYDRNATLILASCGNMPLPKYALELLQPFSNYEVSSQASFAARISDDTPSAATAEGTHIRCFDKLGVVNMEWAEWVSAYKAGQHMVEYYRDLGMLPEVELFHSGPSVLKVLMEYRTATSEPGVHTGADIHAPTPIEANDPKLIETLASDACNESEVYKGRPAFPGVRTVLNLGEALRQCNEMDWSDVVAGTKWTGVECQGYTFGADTLESMAVAQQADMFLSLHGSGEMNSMFMRRDSYKVQMRGAEFGTKHTFMSNGYWPPVCHQNGHPFLCFFINFEGSLGNAWEPGIFERLGTTGPGSNPSLYARDRHVIVNIDHIKHFLKDILPLNRTGHLEKWRHWKVAYRYTDAGFDGYDRHFNIDDPDALAPTKRRLTQDEERQLQEQWMTMRKHSFASHTAS